MRHGGSGLGVGGTALMCVGGSKSKMADNPFAGGGGGSEPQGSQDQCLVKCRSHCDSPLRKSLLQALIGMKRAQFVKSQTRVKCDSQSDAALNSCLEWTNWCLRDAMVLVNLRARRDSVTV